MKPFLPSALAALLAAFLAASTALYPSMAAAQPAVNLTVSLRHVDVQQPNTVTITTQNPQRPLLSAQQVRVRNGGRALFRMDQSIPLQWVTAAAGFRAQAQGQYNGSANVSSGGATPSSASQSGSGGFRERSEGGAFQQQVVWLQTGQSLSVQPSWPGGNAPVDISVDLQQANAGPGTSTMTPRHNTVQVATSLYAALGEWVTIAATGSAQPPGTYSTQAAREPPRALQVRVTLE